MIKVGIAGAAGYTGQELVRCLLQHPQVKLECLLARSHVGKSYSQIFPQFLGAVDNICEDDDSLVDAASRCDVFFLALPHGVSSAKVNEELLAATKVIDLGADFRLKDKNQYEDWYESQHANPGLLPNSVYGLPEWRRDEIKDARLVANPGCYATCSILSLLPLLTAGLVSSSSPLIVDAKSGVSGAGRSLSLDVHFSECNETIKAYKVASHRHTPEIEQELSSKSAGQNKIAFTPHLVPMSRGILVTAYGQLNKDVSAQDLQHVYDDCYKDEPFVKVLSEQSPQTRWVKGSNSCHIGVNVDKRTNSAIVIGALDNLLKGAAGQAVQNMNIMFGLPEITGLHQVSACV